MSEPTVEESTTATENLNRVIALGDEVLKRLKALTTDLDMTPEASTPPYS